jgi:hypothetical protein
MQALQPINEATVTLCKRDADLLTADAVMCMTVDELLLHQHPLSRVFAEILVTRYVQRRNTAVLRLMTELRGQPVYESPAHPIPEGEC